MEQKHCSGWFYVTVAVKLFIKNSKWKQQPFFSICCRLWQWLITCLIHALSSAFRACRLLGASDFIFAWNPFPPPPILYHQARPQPLILDLVINGQIILCTFDYSKSFKRNFRCSILTLLSEYFISNLIQMLITTLTILVQVEFLQGFPTIDHSHVVQ